MDDKELRKKFSDKKFLKSSDLHEFTAKVLQWVKGNQTVVVAVVVLALVIVIAVPSYRYYRLSRIEDFSEKLYAAETGLKKAESLKKLVKDYSDLPAHHVARLRLIQNYLDNQQKDLAVSEIESGIAAGKQDVFTTLLVMRRLDVLKQEGDFAKAVDFATGHRHLVFLAYQKRYDFLTARLHLLAGQKQKAREIYSRLSSLPQGQELIDDISYDPEVVSEAKDQLLLLDLGVM